MSYTSLSNWGPETTPKTIRRLLIATVIISVLSAAIQTIFEQFTLFPGPQQLLSLSFRGLENGYIWQLFSFLFIQDTGIAGISLSFLINLAFACYLIWNVGTALCELVGEKSFLKLYFFSGIGAGMATLLFMLLVGQDTYLAGNAPVVLALLTVWGMLYAEADIYLFFLIPIKAKWLILAVIGGVLLINLSHLDFASLIYYLWGILSGYLYATMVHGWKSPFKEMLSLDLFFIGLGNSIRRNTSSWVKNSRTESISKGNVVDIQTGQPLKDDDAFVDAMLAKISKRGEGSLSWQEKKRLQQISERKRQR